MTAHTMIIATRIPTGPAFDGAARSAASASAVVFRDGINRILTGDEPGAPTVVVAAEAWRRSDGAQLVAAQVQAGRVTWVEVTDASQVGVAIAAGAHGIIACGLEGAGLVGDSSSLVLLRLVLPLAGDLPVLVRGGIGPDTAAGVIAAGASGFVLDTQLWMASDMPVAPAIEALLTSFNPLDTVTFGPGLGFRYRTFGQVATRPVRELRKLEGAEMTGEALYCEVQSRLAVEPALGDPKKELLALGQDAGLSVTFANLFGDVASIVQGVRAGVTKRLAAAQADYPFAAGKGICSTNGTRLPFHQGPMAQVADVPEFAQAIAKSGSMAWLALANMPTSVATELIDDTAALLGDLPWGAGIIGLDANRYRDEHFAMLKEKKPPFVLVAAGTVEQAMDFERADVATWLHTPTPGLLRMALESGLTRFILEGTEAGGHVGPLGSLALWQYGILELERAIAAGLDPTTLAMVPAGGLGDAASSRAAAAILMGLHGQGVAVGLQMGTSYLMTSEAVETGAVSATYQTVIGEAGETLLMGESVSAPTRVLPTAHAHVTFATELDRRSQGVALKERKVAYEHDNLGGLRAAAKSQKIERIDPEKGAIFATISETEQRDTGLFHAGQTAAILGEITDLATYHQRLLEAWSQPLAAPKQVAQAAAATAPAPQPAPSKGGNPDDIVIVGIGAVLPDALNKEAFWENLLAGHCSIREVRPEDRWDPALHWSADRTATDRSYSKIGAFVDDFVPDRKAFRIPPNVLKSIDRVQLFALEAARQALEDAGGFDDSFPRETCAVMIGASQGGDLRLETTFRTEFPVVEKALEDTLEEEGVDPAIAKKIRDRFHETYLAEKTPITEDSMAGELPNCIAGRVAGTFDLGGANWSVDAACASSLAAMNVAVQSLRAGAHDAVVVGGVDSCMSPEPYVKFSKIGALSDSGSRPFDESANGFVMGEGGGMLVVMRRADAEAQGRRIYAIVRGVGASSDGRGKGITAPNPRGQHRAVRRAYEDAGVDPKSVTYFEAHGTGTPVGDPVEVSSLVEVVGRTTHGASLGSVKSNIGHLKAAAGAAALVKTVMALHHKTLPPTLGVTNPNPKLPLEEGNIRLQLERSDWNVPQGVARRAGVSAFGFGGTNVHIVLEEEGAWTSPGNELDSMDAKIPNATASVAMAAAPRAAGPAAAPVASAPASPSAASSVSHEDAYATVVKILCERTGYESDEIEPEFELEADLGIDTVKQAEIMAEVRETYALEKDADFRLARYPTLQDLARYVVERSALQGGVVADAAPPEAPVRVAAEPAAPAAPAAPAPPAKTSSVSHEDAYATVVKILCERTGYESDEIEPEFELEADLGIDTVKQAEIMAEVRETYALEKDADFRLARYPTLQDLARYVVERSALQGGAVAAPAPAAAAPTAPAPAAPAPATSPEPTATAASNGATAWDRLDGLMAFGASTTPELRANLDALILALEGQGMTALEAHLATPSVIAHAVRLAVAFEPTDGPEPLLAILKKTSAALEKGKGMKILANKGVYFSEDAPTGAGGLAFLFPGQGTQYLGMGRDLMDRFPEAAEVFAEADRVMDGDIERPLSSFMHPGDLPDDAAKKIAFKELTRTEITQPAVLTMDAAVLAIMRSLGYRADMVVGHSLGEYGACIAAGVMPFEGALKTVAARGAAMASVRPMNDDNGWMLAVSASAEKVEAQLEGLDGYIVCANKNCHAQTVTGGETETSKKALEKLIAAGFDAQRIPVSHAFHTKIIAPATEALLIQLATIEINEPEIPILSNVTAKPYPTDPDQIRDLLARQVASPVEYIEQIEAMYAAGIHTFVEVGPKKAQVGFVANILEGRDHRAIPTNHPKFGGLSSLRMAIGQLLAAGQAVEAYEARSVESPVVPAPVAQAPTRTVIPEPQRHGDAIDTAWNVKSDVVCTGTAIGLPGLEDAFDEGGFDKLLTGRSLIASMPQEHREAMASKKITRLMKGADGTAEFVSIDSVDEVLKLSGQLGDFDLTRDYGVEERVVAGLDRASQLAFAAGLEALRDAHIPLVPRYRVTRSGKKVTIGSALPESMRDETGVIFASAFTGNDVAIDEATRAATDPDYTFDGRYVLKLIGMGHARFAEQIGARGPNTRINAACASTTQAISIGEDWIRMGRCKRVIVIAGDDVTDDILMPWVGGGFLATGAATQEADVTQAALPFDKRRNGTILGAGAVALVLESPEVAERRGVVPLADLMGTRMANSAFHATRLDVEHIAGEVQALVGAVESRFETPRADISSKGVFVSHETFTPARGGSAAAEVESLRSAFGDGMADIVIANIKGYTGHPMGAGLEDALAVRMLHKRRVPPIPHLEQYDESLGNLTFSDGSELDLDYAIRLAAGFGSQLALGVWRRRAQSENRLDQAAFDAWLKNDAGLENASVWVEKRVLKARSQAVATAPSARAPVSPSVPVVEAQPTAPAPPAAAPATPQAAPQATAGVPTSEEAYARIVTVLCERTGYDADEVEPQFELEADLGIDTVKQAEIMAEVREVYALEKDADFRLASYPTIQDLGRYVIERTTLQSGSAPAPPASESTKPAPTEEAATEEAATEAAAVSVDPSALSEASAYAAIVKILCARTGYDPEEVEPQFELEADLGIDTVKQAEIMAEVREVYALEKDADFRLASYPTIQDLGRYVIERTVAQSSSPPPPASPPKAVEKTPKTNPEPPKAAVAVQAAPKAPKVVSAPAPVASTEVPFLARPVVIREIGAAQADVSAAGTRVQGKSVVIIGGTDEIIEPLESALERLGARVVHLVAGDEDILMDEVALTRKLTGVKQLAGMLNLLGTESLPPLEKPADFALHQSRRTFHVARAWVNILDGSPGSDHFFVSLTNLGGALGHGSVGTTDGTQSLVAGAVAGLTKTLSHEWADATVRVVDLPEDLSVTDPLVILGEALSRGGYREIGLLDGMVHVAETADVEHTPIDHSLGVDTRWLITGGGRGITAVVALDLATRFPGGTFVLTGRTALTHEDPTSIDLDVERARIKAAMKEAGDKVTPVAIGRALKPFEAQKEIAETLATLQAAGAQSRYVAFDVSDAASTRKALGEIGHVDVVIHGAGLEDSRFLMDKDPAVFDRVFVTKVSGLIHLLDALTVNPRAVVAFTSVAGRYGNAGQVDYAAANDALSRMLAAKSRAGDFQGIATDWGPWADVGMATRGSIQTVLEASGVAMMPPEFGAPMVGDLLASGHTGEVVCSGALGALATSPSAGDARAPLFHEVVRDYDGVIGTLRLDAANMAMLDDHRIEGIAVLPGVMGMELFAQATRALDPSTRVVGYEDVVFERPVKAHDGKEISVQVTARPAGDGRVSVVLESLRKLATGKESRTQHFTATVLTGATPGAPDPFLLPTEDLASEGPDADTIYEVFFHERSYRVLDHVPFMGPRGLVAIGQTSEADPAPGVRASQLTSDPLAREAALQAAGLWSMSQDGRMRLPAAIGRVSLLGTAAPGEDIVIRVLPRNSDVEHLARYDAEVWTREGRLLQRLESLDMIDAGPLPEGTGIVAGAARRVLRDFMDISDAELALDRLGLPLERLVTMEDLAAFHRQKNVQRRGEWLSARLAAKRLAGDWLQARFGVRPPPDAMLVVKDEFGAPSLLLRDGWADRLTDGEMMNLSISHSDGVAVAAIPVDPEIRVGIDIERISPRPDAFADTWLESSEMALQILDATGGQANEDARITALWCLKEATTKALGLGFNLAVSEVVVKTIDEHGVAEVGVYGQAADRLVHLGGAEVRAEVRVDPRFAIAESIVIVDGGPVHDDDDAALAAVAALLREKGFLIEGRVTEGDTTSGRSVN